MIAYWQIKSGKWYCSDVGDDYPYGFGDMVMTWRWTVRAFSGHNTMRRDRPRLVTGAIASPSPGHDLTLHRPG